jgi:hypothetical protein
MTDWDNVTWGSEPLPERCFNFELERRIPLDLHVCFRCGSVVQQGFTDRHVRWHQIYDADAK